MHNDAECIAGEAVKVLERARANPNAGVVFTSDDAFAVFNAAAIRDVGPWDETFQWYFSDNDYYRRIQLRGWATDSFGGQGVIHHGSQTLHSEAAVKKEVNAHWQWHQKHYEHQWSGSPGLERYSIPYSGKP